LLSQFDLAPGAAVGAIYVTWRATNDMPFQCDHFCIFFVRRTGSA
jgi:hypothetical protein